MTDDTGEGSLCQPLNHNYIVLYTYIEIWSYTLMDEVS